MLLPALSAARERARSANCVAKLKQIGLAEFMYSGVNKDYVAITNDFSTTATVPEVGFDLAEDDTLSSAPAVNAGDKLLMGGFLGSNLTKETYDSKEKAFKCPSDSVNWQSSGSDAGKVSSYNNAVQAAEAGTLSAASAPRKRLIVGRDNPGCATWYDHHKGIYSTCGGKNNNNHPSNINIGYLGGHVSSRSVKDTQAGNWGFIDEITY